MRTLEVRAEDVVVMNEIRLTELKKIKLAMDHSTVAMDLTDETMKASHDFFTKNFYGWVCATIEAIEDGS